MVSQGFSLLAQNRNLYTLALQGDHAKLHTTIKAKFLKYKKDPPPWFATSKTNVIREENYRNSCFKDNLFCLEQDPLKSVPA